MAAVAAAERIGGPLLLLLLPPLPAPKANTVNSFMASWLPGGEPWWSNGQKSAECGSSFIITQTNKRLVSFAQNRPDM